MANQTAPTAPTGTIRVFAITGNSHRRSIQLNAIQQNHVGTVLCEGDTIEGTTLFASEDDLSALASTAVVENVFYCGYKDSLELSEISADCVVLFDHNQALTVSKIDGYKDVPYMSFGTIYATAINWLRN